MTITNEDDSSTAGAAPAPVAPPPPPPPAAPPPFAWGFAYSDRRLVPAVGLEYGSVLARFAAHWFDLMAITAALVPVSMILGAVGGGAHAVRAHAGLVGLLYAALLIGSDLAYFVLSWTRADASTPGMRLVGLRIGRFVDGRAPTPREAAVRWLTLRGVILAISSLVVIVVETGAGGGATVWAFAADVWMFVMLATTMASPMRQGLHDRIARTVIVQPAGLTSQGRAWALIGLALVGEVAIFVVASRL